MIRYTVVFAAIFLVASFLTFGCAPTSESRNNEDSSESPQNPNTVKFFEGIVVVKTNDAEFYIGAGTNRPMPFEVFKARSKCCRTLDEALNYLKPIVSGPVSFNGYQTVTDPNEQLVELTEFEIQRIQKLE